MRTIIILSLLLVTGCAKTLYDWGDYQGSVARMYGSPGDDKSVLAERDQLAEEIATTVKRGKRIPPGKSAHVGYLSFLAGDKVGAVRCFEQEKRDFPESSRFMDDMLKRLQ